LRIGLGILAGELEEQFLADGGHFELSPMYHALSFEDLLDLINVAAAFPGVLPPAMLEQISRRALSARRWLRAMSHPDGRIAFFNDAAFGVAPETWLLEAYAERLNIGNDAKLGRCEFLKSSGYVRASAGPAVLLADLACIGPDYLPGHAHADT